MEKTTKHLEDISEIRQIMERSTRFLSLSGWSGIFAGVFAIIGAIIAFIYLNHGANLYAQSIKHPYGDDFIHTKIFLLSDAIIVLILALFFAIFFSIKKARKLKERIWSPVTKRLLFQLSVPLISGGLLSVILMWQDHMDLIAPLTLIFYGLALVNAGKYTNREIVYLGIAEIVTGLAAVIWNSYGLWFWTLGFGLFHIVYGIALFYNYDRNAN